MSGNSRLDVDHSLVGIFHTLSTARTRGMTSCGVEVTDTVTYQHGSLRWWYFYEKPRAVQQEGGARSEKPGQVMRKDKRDCTPGKIESAFTRGASEEGPVATFLYRSQMRHGEGDSQPISVEFLDAAGLRDFLHHRESKPDGILQKFSCMGAHNSVTQIVWTPYLARAVRYQNVHKMKNSRVGLYQRCATHEGKSHLSREIICPPHTVEELSAACRQISAHYHSVEHRLVTRLVLYFKINQHKKTLLLYPSAVITTKFRPQVNRGLGAPGGNGLSVSSGKVDARQKVKQDESTRRVLLDLNPVYVNATASRDKKGSRAELGGNARLAGPVADNQRQIFMTPSGVFLSPADVLHGLETNPTTQHPNALSSPKNLRSFPPTSLKYATFTESHDEKVLATLQRMRMSPVPSASAASRSQPQVSVLLSGRKPPDTASPERHAVSPSLSPRSALNNVALDVADLDLGEVGTAESPTATGLDRSQGGGVPQYRFCRGGGAGVYEAVAYRKQKRRQRRMAQQRAEEAQQGGTWPLASGEELRRKGRLIRVGSYGRIFEHSRELAQIHLHGEKAVTRKAQAEQQQHAEKASPEASACRACDALEAHCGGASWGVTRGGCRFFDTGAGGCSDGVFRSEVASHSFMSAEELTATGATMPPCTEDPHPSWASAFEGSFEGVVEDTHMQHMFFFAFSLPRHDAVGDASAAEPRLLGDPHRPDRVFVFDAEAMRPLVGLMGTPVAADSAEVSNAVTSPAASPSVASERERPLSLPHIFALVEWYALQARCHSAVYYMERRAEPVTPPAAASWNDFVEEVHASLKAVGGSDASAEEKARHGVSDAVAVPHPYYLECPVCAQASAAALRKGHAQEGVDCQSRGQPAGLRQELYPLPQVAASPLQVREYRVGMAMYSVLPAAPVHALGQAPLSLLCGAAAAHRRSIFGMGPAQDRPYWADDEACTEALRGEAGAEKGVQAGTCETVCPQPGGSYLEACGVGGADFDSLPQWEAAKETGELLSDADQSLYVKLLALLPKPLRGFGFWGWFAREVREEAARLVAVHAGLVVTLEELAYLCYTKREKKFSGSQDHVVSVAHETDALLQGRLHVYLAGLSFTEVTDDTEKVHYLKTSQLNVQKYTGEMCTPEACMKLVPTLRVWVCRKVSCTGAPGLDEDCQAVSTYRVRQVLTKLEAEIKNSMQHHLSLLYADVVTGLRTAFIEFPALVSRRQQCCAESRLLRGNISAQVLSCLYGYACARHAALTASLDAFLASHDEDYEPLIIPISTFSYFDHT